MPDQPQLIELPPAARAILEAAPDAMVVTDRQGRIVLASPQAERLFGYEAGEMIGQPVEILIPDRYRRRHPSQRNHYFLDPRARPMGAPGIDLWGRRKDGSEFPAEIGLSPLETPDGMLAITSVRDVSVRRRHETRFRSLLEAAPDAIVITDQADKIVLFNAQAERLFGYRRAELLGEKIAALVPQRLRGAHEEYRQRQAQAGEPPTMGGGIELCGLRKDGTEFPVELSLSPLDTEEGPLLMTAVRDISDRRRVEQERLRLAQAQEALRVRDEFLAVTAHELRTPLTAQRLQLEGLHHLLRRSGDPFAARLLERLQKAMKQGQRLTELVDTLLDVSRIMAGELALQLERAKLAQLVRSVADDFREQAERQGTALLLELEDVAIVCDRFRVEQILTNLLSNAVKYGAGQPVRVRLQASGDGGARLSVKDEGIGISADDAERIFERFERAASFRHYGGIGLGLYIARHLAEAHGGSIRVESEPQRGALFVVELPGRPAKDTEYSTPLGAAGEDEAI